MFAEYGAVFAADVPRRNLPAQCFFQNGSDARKFQKSLDTAVVMIDGVRTELQAAAMRALLAARSEARKRDLKITPVATDSAGRTYEDTLTLWRDRVNDSLRYWLEKKRIGTAQAEAIRKAPVEKQVAEVFKLEEKGLLFGRGHKKSILGSVAAPGYSQHLLFLALDVKQHANKYVTAILARHGWFQTVRNDTPHFTYLGLGADSLAAAGLNSEHIAGREVWTVKREGGHEKSAASPRPGRKPLQVKDEKIGEDTYLLHVPSREIPATMSEDVLLPVSVKRRLGKLTREYLKRTGRRLHITSGYRTPYRQALAMYQNLHRYPLGYVLGTYVDKGAAWQIVNAYLENKGDPQKAVSRMTAIILAQTRGKRFISNHLLEAAFDIRRFGAGAADPNVLRVIVSEMGGELVWEKDHYHVEFR
jgi:hypothetical protein